MHSQFFHGVHYIRLYLGNNIFFVVKVNSLTLSTVNVTIGQLFIKIYKDYTFYSSISPAI